MSAAKAFVGRHWLRLLAGLAAGFVAAFAMTLMMLVLRRLFGVPLTSELGGDRVLPHIDVTNFLSLLSTLGGTIKAKETAYDWTFYGQILATAPLGVLLAILVERDRERHPDGARRLGLRPIDLKFAGIVVGATWVVLLIFFFPVLNSNYRGFTGLTAGITTAIGLLLSFGAFGIVVVYAYRGLVHPGAQSEASEHRIGPVNVPGSPRIWRRQFLVGAFGAAAGLVALRLGITGKDRSTLSYDGMRGPIGTKAKAITPNDEFYTVTKNIIDPRVNESLWSLDVGGEVQNAKTYSLDDLKKLPSVERAVTLNCISNGVGGHLISNAVWKGVPIWALIEDSKPTSNAKYIFLTGVDGFAHGLRIDRAKAMDTHMIAYEMNGKPLPDHHGFPARALVPTSYGEGSVKWITQIDVLDHVRKGYYENQGWKSEDPGTMSRIDVPATGDKLPFPSTTRIHGVAHAFGRGIKKVQVSTDGGNSWHDAQIDYQRTPAAWSTWSYAHKPKLPGKVDLVVRAIDGTGAVQVQKSSGVDPDGSSGWQSFSVMYERSA